MNICIVSTYSCTFDDFSAIVDEYEETFKVTLDGVTSDGFTAKNATILISK